MVKVYCYDRCSTCKKALSWLDEHKIGYEKLDIKTQNPDVETLKTLHEKSGLPLKRFFNSSGMLYKELELSKKLPGMSEEEQYNILSTDGMLVKRPLLVTDNEVFPGFKEVEWERILK